MKKFSSIKAAFAIIDFAKNHPKFTIKFILAFALVMLLSLTAFYSTGFVELFIQMVINSESPEKWPYEKAFMDATNLINILYIVCWFFYIVFSSAGLRKAIRNEEIGFHGFTWGKDETRILLSYLVLIAIMIAAYLGIGLFFLIATGIGVFIKSIPIIAPLYGIIVGGLGSFFVYWLIIRLSQFGVLTIAQRKMGTIDSIKETKGHGWSFFWAYFINTLVVSVSYLILIGFGFAAYKITGKFPITAMELLNPAWLFVFILAAIIMGIFILSRICLGSYAYHMMHEGEELPQESASENVWKN